MLTNKRIYVFVCVNKKLSGKCCSMFNSEHVYESLKEKLNKKRYLLKDKSVKIVKTSCLGQCSAGPNIYIVPHNVWYTYSCPEDIEELIDLCLIKGQQAVRLINKKVFFNQIETNK